MSSSEPQPPESPPTQHPHPHPQQQQGQPQRRVIYAVPANVQGYTVVEVVPTAPSVVCPYCGVLMTPLVSYEPSIFAWLMCITLTVLLMPFFCIGLLIGWLILVADSLQVPKYVCPFCGRSIGMVV